MKREEHLKFCKKCVNRELDMKVGLVCNLSGSIANFTNECSSYKLDESIIEKPDDTEALEHNTVLDKLSQRNLDKLKSEQKFPTALITGIVVGVLGAILWGVVTVATGYQIGYMAIAVGAAIGISMRVTGKGIDQIFGITGGLIAIFSCLLGNFFSIVGFLADSEELSYFDTLTLIDYSQIMSIMSETFSPIDLLFYGIAAYEGYKLSFRSFTEEEISELEKQPL